MLDSHETGFDCHIEENLKKSSPSEVSNPFKISNNDNNPNFGIWFVIKLHFLHFLLVLTTPSFWLFPGFGSRLTWGQPTCVDICASDTKVELGSMKKNRNMFKSLHCNKSQNPIAHSLVLKWHNQYPPNLKEKCVQHVNLIQRNRSFTCA